MRNSSATAESNFRWRGSRHGAPLRWILPGLVLAALALAGCGGSAHQPPAGVLPAYDGQVRPSCGPADGPAMDIELHPVDTGGSVSVSISLWGAGHPDVPLVKEFTNSGGGWGTWCPTDGSCREVARGTVWFDRLDADGRIIGRFWLGASSGEVLQGSFAAEESRGVPVLCG